MSVNYSAAIGIGMMLGDKVLPDSFISTYSNYIHYLHYDDDRDIFVGEITAETDSYLNISNRTWYQNAEYSVYFGKISVLSSTTLLLNLNFFYCKRQIKKIF